LRKKFDLGNSIDFLVREREPFPVADRYLTIAEIKDRLSTKVPSADLEALESNRTEWNTENPGRDESSRETPKVARVLGSFTEKDLEEPDTPVEESPAGVPEKNKIVKRMPVAEAKESPAGSGAEAGGAALEDLSENVYFGVRIVRPGENIWNIHYEIFREYFKHRDIDLPAQADEPLPDGSSSGVGRLLKFTENVVYVYNVEENRLESNIDLIHPDNLIVFFKASDLFDALDRIGKEDIQWLRYIARRLKLNRPEVQKELLREEELKLQ
jgi:hypothetical protein